jgi:hypothetical protein
MNMQRAAIFPQRFHGPGGMRKRAFNLLPLTLP